MSTWDEVVRAAANAWSALEEHEYDAVWNRFERQFRFRPSVKAKDWPGIKEPEDSITYAIGDAYGDEEHYRLVTTDLCARFLDAFRRCVAESEWLYVLDWQHPAYRFWPHRDFPWSSETEWPVPVFPNGDYYVFLEPAFAFGVFGHPWEQTMCVFGQPLLDQVATDPPALFARRTRVGGRTV